MKDKINVVITDDHKLFRKGMVALVEDFEFIGEIAEAGNGAELLGVLAGMKQLPDVILLDLKMPVMDGVEAHEKIRQLYPEIKVIILTMEDDEQYILHLISEGVNGYLFKNADPEEVENAIIKVMEKGLCFPENISDIVIRNLSKKEKPEIVFNPGFTEREQEVLALICEQYTAAEIADELNVSVRTAEGYRQKLLEKSGTKNTVGLIINALKYNWVTLK
jgi:DNA-binding NarL/FixJ family response regulator